MSGFLDGVAYLESRALGGTLMMGFGDGYETVSLWNGPIVFTSYIFFFLNSGENSKASQDIVQPKTARNSIEGKQIKGAPRPLHHTH